VKIPTVGDLVRMGAEQIEALAALPDSIALLNRSLTNFAATVSRLDTLVQRLDRVTEPLEEPLTKLAPRLDALVPLLDEEVMASLPAVLDAVNRNAVPALEVIGQTQAQVASIAASVERLMHVMDDTFSRLQELPGINLVNRLRAGSDRAARASAGTGTARPVRSASPPAPPVDAAVSPAGEGAVSPAGDTPPDPAQPPSPPPGTTRAGGPGRRPASSAPEERRGWGG